MGRILPIAVFLSGEGTTCDALAELIAGGHLPARLVLVLADRPHAPGIERARHRGVPTAVRPLHGADRSSWSEATDVLLHERGAELVVLAGFLGILPPDFVRRWAGRVINVHPSLLPKYGGAGMYGPRVHAAVLADAAPQTGATVHVVTEQVDAGPILLQETIPVLPGDDVRALRQRVRPVEVRLLAETIRRFADGEWALPYSADPRTPRSRRAPSGVD